MVSDEEEIDGECSCGDSLVCPSCEDYAHIDDIPPCEDCEDREARDGKYYDALIEVLRDALGCASRDELAFKLLQQGHVHASDAVRGIS